MSKFANNSFRTKKFIVSGTVTKGIRFKPSFFRYLVDKTFLLNWTCQRSVRLVPRVFALFDQRVRTRRDSGINAVIFPETRGSTLNAHSSNGKKTSCRSFYADDRSKNDLLFHKPKFSPRPHNLLKKKNNKQELVKWLTLTSFPGPLAKAFGPKAMERS